MQIADNFSTNPPLPEHPSPAEQNSASPPPVWWMKLRLESIQRRLEAIYARMAVLQRLRGKSGRSSRIYRRLAQEAAALLLAAGLLLTPAGGPLHAAGITVDGTNCTLAEAITSANNDNAAGNGCVDGSGDDTITLQANVDLTAELDPIQSTITIEGSGFTIQRTGGSNFRIFTIDGGNLTVNHATISGGNLSGDHGAGISVSDGTLTLNNSTVSGNSTDESGGGIYTSGNGVATLNNSTVSGNSAVVRGGGFLNQGTLTLNNSTISGNSAVYEAGGIGTQSGTVTLNNTTVTDNECTYGNAPYGYCFGGGIYAYSTSLTLAHTLISGNTSTGAGSELYASASTITANNHNLFGHNGETYAQAFYGFTPGASDIVAASNPSPGGATHTATALGNILNTTLTDNGGPTLTHALVSGSPAINAVPDSTPRGRSALAATCTPSTSYDQRGVFRANGPATTGNACDIGSFEFNQAGNPTAVTIAGFSSQTAWGSGPQLAWETGNESGLSGFHIWLGTSSAARTRLTDNLIGATGGLNGGQYTWQDSVVFGWGERVWYWLEAVNADGSSSFTGPVEVFGIGRLFLPAIGR